MYNWKVAYVCKLIDVFFGLYNPPHPTPPRPDTPFTYAVYVYRDILLFKGHLGFRGEAFKIKLKDTSFIFSMTNVISFSILHTHAQNEYHNVLEMKSISILNILALLPFKN